MNITRPLALAFLATAAVAASAQMPKVEMALLVDTAHNLVHRVDLQTGRYFGTIGMGKLVTPQAIAVDSAKGIAYVSDYVGVKKFDISTGRYLGMLLSGSSAALVCEPNGNVDAIIGSAGGFVVRRMNPNNGATIAQSAVRPWSTNAGAALTLSPQGAPEAWVLYQGLSIVDHFATNLQYQSFTIMQTTAVSPVHAKSGDTFFNAMYNGSYFVYSGTSLGAETLTNTSLYPFDAAAEGANGLVYELGETSVPGQFDIAAYDTLNGQPYAIGSMSIKLPSVQYIWAMAVYVRF